MGRPPNWRCEPFEKEPHWLTGFAKRYGEGDWGLCQRHAEAAARDELRLQECFTFAYWEAVVDALDQERKNLQDETRAAGREIQDLVSDLEYERSRRDDW